MAIIIVVVVSKIDRNIKRVVFLWCYKSLWIGTLDNLFSIPNMPTISRILFVYSAESFWIRIFQNLIIKVYMIDVFCE